jgi:hypothetical protein
LSRVFGIGNCRITSVDHLEKTFKPIELPQNEDLETEINKRAERTATNNTTNQILYTKGNPNILQKDLNPRKAPGYDLITGRILKEMPGIVHLTKICNAIIRKGYFPVQWKVAQIIMIPKSGKLLEEASLCRQTSLLPIMNKIYEKAMLKRLLQIQEENRILPDNQFGFRQKHSTREQDNKTNLREKKNSTALRSS